MFSIEVTYEHRFFLFFGTYEKNVVSIEVTYNSFQITDCSIGFEKVYLDKTFQKNNASSHTSKIEDNFFQRF